MAPSTNWQERIDPAENERFERYAKALAENQARFAKKQGMSRALHAKAHLGLKAEFEVFADLPEHARQGMFATPGKYAAYVRYSNGAARKQKDRTPDVRGMAVKIVGVPGKKIIPGMEDAKTQDFLCIRTSSQPFRNADEFLPFVLATFSPATALPKLLWAFGPVRLFQLAPQLAKGLRLPMSSYATTSFFSALPFRLGPYAVRCAFRAATPASGPDAPCDDYATELSARLAQGPLAYDFQLQFFVDEKVTPIEDASVDWAESVAPYVTVGRLVIPQQDVTGETGQKLSRFVEKLSFDPWHAREDMRPLGNMMRARNAAYRESTKQRVAAPEPDGSESLESAA